MKKGLLLAIGLGLATIAVSAQAKPVLVINAFTAASGVDVPYDLKSLQAQLVPEFKVLLGERFDVVAEAPTTSHATTYTLDAEIVAWRAGNAAKRFLIGMGSGREATDIRYRVTDGSGQTALERKETIRTSIFAQGMGSTGTLAHPIAKKIAGRINDANLQ